METEIKKIAEYVSSDIEAIRKSDVETKDRIGIEIMALNALCNAEKVLKNKCQC